MTASYQCIKCPSTEATTGEIRTTGSGFSRFLNLQNQKYAALSCADCGYTEFYKQSGGGLAGNIFDVLTN